MRRVACTICLLLALTMLWGCGKGKEEAPMIPSVSEIPEEVSTLLEGWQNYCRLVNQQTSAMKLGLITEKEVAAFELKPGYMVYGSGNKAYMEDLNEKEKVELEGQLTVFDLLPGMTYEDVVNTGILTEGNYLENRDDSHQICLAWYPEEEGWKQLSFAEDEIENHNSLILLLIDFVTADSGDGEVIGGFFCECY